MTGVRLQQPVHLHLLRGHVQGGDARRRLHRELLRGEKQFIELKFLFYFCFFVILIFLLFLFYFILFYFIEGMPTLVLNLLFLKMHCTL